VNARADTHRRLNAVPEPGGDHVLKPANRDVIAAVYTPGGD